MHKLGKLIHFLVGIAFIGDRHIDAKHIAKVIIDDGRAGAGGQLGLAVRHLAAQFIPDLGQFSLAVVFLDKGLDDGKTTL